MSRIRKSLYRGGSVLGDVEAVAKGKLPQRLFRKFLWRLVGRLLR